MNVRFSALAALVGVVVTLPSSSLFAAKTITSEPKHGSTVVELFDAIEKKVVKVTVIPSDASKLTMQIENRGDKPLSIQLPVGFAAAPVLAQFDDLFGGNGGQNQGGNNQAVGGQMGRGNGNNNQFNFGNNRQGNAGFFNIPPGKVIKKRIETVCLEHGKPDPNARIAYEIRPLASFSDNPALAELMAAFASGKPSQRVVQLAAWHLTDDLSWEQLSQLSGKHINGKRYRLYTDNEVRQARALVEALPSYKSTKVQGTSLTQS